MGYSGAGLYEERGSDLFECQWAVASGQRTVDDALSAISTQRRFLNDIEDALRFGVFGNGGVRHYPPSYPPSLYDPPPPASARENAIYTSQLISQMMGTAPRSTEPDPPTPVSTRPAPLFSKGNIYIAGGNENVGDLS